ncbi:MAG: HPr family phosphocarrier protein [Shewanella sp.]|nr:HPr family phosphocarrier protein [Shewanella sp.]MCF1431571.1 HPr family phosphocarrier protein [Shewanella sp.]MCF1437879.1 HPr family phosphocarrier protein [Shewanella sp.]MCF1456897.1 HPr family phosphocarrier protein [Shewanella sp.]
MNQEHSQTLIIQAKHGIHTRPGALFVKAAKAFQADITLSCGGKEANGKSLFKLQTLQLSKGAQVALTARGDDAKAAVEALSQLLLELE